MKTILTLSTVAALCFGVSSSCPAAIEIHPFDYSSAPVPIPDGSLAGVSLSGTVQSGFSSITSVSVSLDLSGRGPAGGWNGDIYATLFHDGEVVVLLNRPGVTAANEIGYGDSGMNVLFSDTAARNIRNYREALPGGKDTPLAGTLGGTWAPDGRAVDPELLAALTPGTAFPVTELGDFSGMDPNGSWTLFVADCDHVGLSQVSGWSLRFEGTNVPELLNTAFPLLGALGLTVLLALRCSRNSILRRHRE